MQIFFCLFKKLEGKMNLFPIAIFFWRKEKNELSSLLKRGEFTLRKPDNDSDNEKMKEEKNTRPTDFIREMVEEDLSTNKYKGKVHTRFPPEPNGYLHIGHAKAICIDFGIAADYGGLCNLRFDDTNPIKEESKYAEAMKEDIRWLGFDWEDREYYASDYYGKLYEYAIKLIKDGKAYVDDLSAEEIRQTRGTLTEPGKESSYRNRSVEENLDLFERMRKGE
ncbi:MAG: hypothetical protein AMJ90_02615, partial [candidate division Zixibacteria bacterium SM23_73_2]